MKKIPLTQGKFALVDDEDFEYINQWKWCAAKSASGGFYAVKVVSKKCISMHRLILGAPFGKAIDHRDGDGLNNQKNNLRYSTKAENGRNRGKNRNNTSGYKGVMWNKANSKWVATVVVDRVRKYLGCFTCPIEAARAYNAAAIKYHGEFANLNTIPA